MTLAKTMLFNRFLRFICMKLFFKVTAMLNINSNPYTNFKLN